MPFSETIRTIRLAMKSLLLHKLRSGLTMLGIVFGVFSVIAMLAIGEGASAQDSTIRNCKEEALPRNKLAVKQKHDSDLRGRDSTPTCEEETRHQKEGSARD